ncbi:AMP-binding protein [Cellulomonas sp. ATA003]|uniref:AMP-binding protein n=1 Tax=Cellulomonas sp. ATA003 TaxID=3073064 RepID=UPI0028739EF5|nr:AMP-binding protein [Cellulomonas sp. ATA003]WNB85936.1 AMP-binding protein [Cellulomonas sp. ATA003]
MTRDLRAVPAGPGDVGHLAQALRAALDGDGPAVVPVAPATTPDLVTDATAPTCPVTRRPDLVPDDVAVVVTTSGSTGTPRGVMLSASALRASAAATDARLGGPAQWLLTLPAHHVAGLQVVVRSLLAGTVPVVAGPGAFRPDGFVADAARLTGDRRYTSLVPTQLHRLLDDDAGRAALRTFDAVLLGGAAAPPALLDRARSAGVAVVTTYGMSETCGGCVYDGVPLDGVRVRLDDDGAVLVAGPVLATGYLGRPDLDAETFTVPAGRRADEQAGAQAGDQGGAQAGEHTDDHGGARWLRTHDLGRIDDGRLTVLGRADDVVVTGGVKVAPAAVEALMAGLPGVGEVCVVGVPDAEWGQVVVAVVVPRAGQTPPEAAQVRAHVAATLGAPAAPRHVVAVDRLPLRGPGKVDRRGVAGLAAARLDRRADPRTPS